MVMVLMALGGNSGIDANIDRRDGWGNICTSYIDNTWRWLLEEKVKGKYRSVKGNDENWSKM